MKFSTAELADALGGESRGPSVEVDGLAIDSRTIAEGQLFAAITGERDGHDFVTAALGRGAAAVLVSSESALRSGDPAVVVDDVNRALADLARLARARISAEVVGVTGSVGKTTTKDLMASVLGRSFRTTASEKSFNNELGVPLTLINAPDGTQVAVVEMGARGRGHIEYLCSMASPDVGVVTTVEGVHTEVMGDVEQIAIAKGELIESLPSSGLAVLNSDVPLVAEMARLTTADVITFGRSGDVRARGVKLDGDLLPSFVIVSPWGEVAVRIGARGVHNVSNALAAAAVGLHLGVPLEKVAEGLVAPLRSPWRMELRRNSAGASILNDCYNASPASMAAALRALASLNPGGGAALAGAVPGAEGEATTTSTGEATTTSTGDPAHTPSSGARPTYLGDSDGSGSDSSRKIAVVGLMAELGDTAEVEHRDIAVLAQDLGIELLAVGTELYGTEPVPDISAALEFLSRWHPTEGDAVLVKGSRVAGLEELAAELNRW